MCARIRQNIYIWLSYSKVLMLLKGVLIWKMSVINPLSSTRQGRQGQESTGIPLKQATTIKDYGDCYSKQT